MIDYELSPFPVDLPLFAGQNSNADPRVLDPQALTLVENGRFATGGQIAKRYGYKTLPAINAADGSSVRVRQLFSAGNTFFAYDGHAAYVRDDINDYWRPLGGLCSARVYNRVLQQTTQDVTEIASAASSQAVLVVWGEGGALRYSIINATTGNYIVAAKILSHYGQRPQVVVCQNTFYVVWFDVIGQTLKLAKFPPDNLGSAPEYEDSIESNYLGTSLGPGRYFSLCASSASPYLVTSVDATGSTLAICKRLADDSVMFAGGGNWGDDSQVWCYATSEDSCIWGNKTFWASVDANFGLSSGPLPANVRRVAGTNGVAWLEKEEQGQVYVQRATFSVGTGFIEGEQAFRTNPNTYFASQAFTLDGTPHLWVLADFKFQSQLFLINADCKPVGRALTNGLAAPFDGIGASLPHVTSTPNGYYLGARRRAKLKFDAAGNATTSVSATLVSLRTDGAHVQAVQVGGSVYVGGAAPKLYDGNTLSELGFYFYGDTLELTEQIGAGGLSEGTYTYAMCYAWYDNAGKLWRSPLILIPVSTNNQPNGASGGTIKVSAGSSVAIGNIRYLQGSLKQGVFIELYRTKADLAQLYKLAEIANADQLGVVSTTYIDGLADSALVGEAAYTDGSSPSYLSPPAFAYITATPNRVYGLVTETGEVWVSSLSFSTAPAQFLLGQTLEVPTLAQPPNCIEIMGGGLYIFSPSNVLVTNADGNYLAAAGTVQFQPPRVLPTDAGCISPASLLETENGLWFQSPRGVMLLDPSQRIGFVGEPLKNYQGLVVAAYSVPEQQQVRFLTGERVLVFDYFFKRWAIHTLGPLASGTFCAGTAYAAMASGAVKRETVGSFKDDHAHYSLKLVTPWIKPAGIAGYARCWRAMILGEGKSAHKLQVRIAYQYDDTWIDCLSFDSGLVTINGVFGEQGIYGLNRSGTFGAIPAVNYQFEIVMPRQKATSYRFELSDLPEPDAGGESVVLNMLSLRCGAYPGMGRLPASKVHG